MGLSGEEQQIEGEKNQEEMKTRERLKETETGMKPDRLECYIIHFPSFFDYLEGSKSGFLGLL